MFRSVAKEIKMSLSVNSYLKEVEEIKNKATALSNKEFSDTIDENGHQYVDLVMEGGGVLGLALVGYIYILEKAGIRFIGIAGTSAGSIAALLLSAVDIPEKEKSEQLINMIANMPINTFIDGKKDGDYDPKKFMDTATGLMNAENKSGFKYFRAFLRFLSTTDNLKIMHGLNRGDEFESWLKKQLSSFNIYTVSDLRKRMATTPPGWKIRSTSIDKASQLEGKLYLDELDVNHDYLCLITADLATEYKVELPVMADLYWEKPKDVNPAVFCRCSMSIPFVFQPYTVKIPHMDNNLQLKWQKYTGISFQSRLATRFPPPIACFVDGGIMSNFPIDVFHNPTKIPARPTFGVKLQLDDHSHEINSTLDIFAQSFNTARHAMNYDFIKKNPDYNKLVSFIDTGDIGWLDFSMSDTNKLKLFRLGAETAYQFLINFDWQNYKKIRRDITSAYQTSLPLAKLNRYFKNK